MEAAGQQDHKLRATCIVGGCQAESGLSLRTLLLLRWPDVFRGQRLQKAWRPTPFRVLMGQKGEEGGGGAGIANTGIELDCSPTVTWIRFTVLEVARRLDKV